MQSCNWDVCHDGTGTQPTPEDFRNEMVLALSGFPEPALAALALR
jgi:hypothetical protein